ncbi:glycosyl hydrolase family 35, partial [Opisthorchis viverrini]
MVQLENEYGYTKACDRDYMSMLYDLARYHLGQKVILFTTDGNSLQILRCGSPDQRYLATIDFAPTTIPPNVSFDSVEKFRPGQPLVNSEFYTGWYDTWGSEHAHRSAELVQESLIDLMNYSPRVNVNILVSMPCELATTAGKEDNGTSILKYDGFVMYCVTIPAGKSELNVTLTKFADIAHVFTSDGGLEMFHWHGNLKAPNNKISLYMRELPSHTKLMLLLENTGYVNFGELMWNNIKGLLGTVTANNQILGPWEMMPIKPLVELDQRAILKHKSDDLPVQGAIFTGDLTIPEASDLADTFIEPVGFSRGFAAVNNHLLGHFDQNLGPQLRLYVPKQFLTPGQNRIIVCELQTLLEPTPKVWSFAETKWTVKAE